MIRISMFSGPRNISTTMMRAFENRADTIVHDEPFYAAYLSESGAQHPMRQAILDTQPHAREDVVANLEKNPTDGENISFEKNIAFHFAKYDDDDWLKGVRIIQLIRDPRAMVASYANKYDDVAPIIDNLTVQRRIFDFAEANGQPTPVVDASDMLKAPKAMLRALCSALDIRFDEAMLNWPAGRRDSDGVWGAHWYDAVEKSTGFQPYLEREIHLSGAHEEIAEACRPDYEFFYARRITAGS
ncbi:MAG: HAD family hydrolase [Marinicaulis sp.]|nr:HAD family hydrolase [Marinicaulis sp.]